MDPLEEMQALQAHIARAESDCVEAHCRLEALQFELETLQREVFVRLSTQGRSVAGNDSDDALAELGERARRQRKT